MLISIGRWFPKVLSTRQIFCPHEKHIRIAIQTRYVIMVGFLFVPIIPVARIIVWRCETCTGTIAPNIDGEHSRSAIRGYRVIALCGYILFAIFAFVACYIGGKDGAFAEETIYIARGIFGLVAAAGLWIVARARRNYRRVSADLERMGQLAPERMTTIQSSLEPGDDLEKIVLKLKEKEFSDAEINTFVRSWVAPELNVD